MAYIFCIKLIFSSALLVSSVTTSVSSAERPERYKKGPENSGLSPLTRSVRYRSDAEELDLMSQNLARSLENAKPWIATDFNMKPVTKGESEEERNMRIAQERSQKELDERRFKLSQAEVCSSEDDLDDDEDFEDKTYEPEEDSDIGRLSNYKFCVSVPVTTEKSEAPDVLKKSRRFKDLDADYQEHLKALCLDHILSLQGNYMKFGHSLGYLLTTIKLNEKQLESERVAASKATERAEISLTSVEAEQIQINHFVKIAELDRMKKECAILLECFKNDGVILIQIEEFVVQTLKDVDIFEAEEVTNFLSRLGYGSKSNNLSKKDGAIS